MAVYNQPADSANTGIRAFLTQVGEFYLGRSFNTSSGKAKNDWLRIKQEVFEEECAYCGQSEKKLQMEHLVMFNRKDCGLHHPGNIVPCCTDCNKREKDEDQRYVGWEVQLELVCKKNNDIEKFFPRKKKIQEHIKSECYPSLNEAERHAIYVIANSLYENIKGESAKSLSLYKDLDEKFVKGGRDN